MRNFQFLDPTPPPAPVRIAPPSVTVTKTYITLRKSMAERIGFPKFVKLGYDKASNMLAIVPCSDVDPLKISVSNNKQGTSRFAIKRVFTKYGLPVPDSQITRDALFEENYIIFSVDDLTIKKPTP